MAEILLLHGEVALVDDELLDQLLQHRWYLDSRGYARAKIRGRSVRMHRLITTPGNGKEVDHRNGNKLDNRVANLRVCTHAENTRNRGKCKNNQCGVKGVYKDERKHCNPYRAQIRVDGVKIGLGSFGTAEDAAAAYKAAAKKYHGEFASA